VYTRASLTDILARKSRTKVGTQVGELNGPRAAGRSRRTRREDVGVGVGVVEFQLYLIDVPRFVWLTSVFCNWSIDLEHLSGLCRLNSSVSDCMIAHHRHFQVFTKGVSVSTVLGGYLAHKRCILRVRYAVKIEIYVAVTFALPHYTLFAVSPIMYMFVDLVRLQ